MLVWACLVIRLGQQPSYKNEGVPSTGTMEHTPHRTHLYTALIDSEIPIWSRLGTAGKHSSEYPLQSDQTYLWDNSLISLHHP